MFSAACMQCAPTCGTIHVAVSSQASIGTRKQLHVYMHRRVKYLSESVDFHKHYDIPQLVIGVSWYYLSIINLQPGSQPPFLKIHTRRQMTVSLIPCDT